VSGSNQTESAERISYLGRLLDVLDLAAKVFA